MEYESKWSYPKQRFGYRVDQNSKEEHPRIKID